MISLPKQEKEGALILTGNYDQSAFFKEYGGDGTLGEVHCLPY